MVKRSLPIPDPQPTVDSLYLTVKSIKELLEIRDAIRTYEGNFGTATPTWNDLVALGLIEAKNVPTKNRDLIPLAEEEIIVPPALTYANCRLNYQSTSLLTLSRFNGKYLSIIDAGVPVPREIPSAGVDLNVSGTAVGVLYYIYAYWDGTSIVLEYSTTAPATDTNTGLSIKTGDSTRSLVGMARTVTGPAWENSVSRKLVASYYNRRPIVAKKTWNNAYSTAAAGTAFVQVNSVEFVDLVNWVDEQVYLSWMGSIDLPDSGGASSVGSFQIFTDGASNTSVIGQQEEYVSLTGNQFCTVALGAFASLAQGYHFHDPRWAVATVGHTISCRGQHILEAWTMG